MASEVLTIRVEIDPAALTEMQRLSRLLDEMRPQLEALSAMSAGSAVVTVVRPDEADIPDADALQRARQRLREANAELAAARGASVTPCLYEPKRD